MAEKGEKAKRGKKSKRSGRGRGSGKRGKGVRPSKRKAIEVFSRRSKRSRAADLAKRARRTFDPTDPRGFELWLRHPERCDLEGVDTPGARHRASRYKAVELPVGWDYTGSGRLAFAGSAWLWTGEGLKFLKGRVRDWYVSRTKRRGTMRARLPVGSVIVYKTEESRSRRHRSKAERVLKVTASGLRELRPREERVKLAPGFEAVREVFEGGLERYRMREGWYEYSRAEAERKAWASLLKRLGAKERSMVVRALGSEPVRLKVRRVARETGRAVLVELSGGAQLWLPKSLVRVSGDVIEFPAWLADKKWQLRREALRQGAEPAVRYLALRGEPLAEGIWRRLLRERGLLG